jgi:SAM-dependent methyltransferase
MSPRSPWEDFWNTFPKKFGREEYLRQVGRTSQGRPISERQLDLLISDILSKLDVRPEDDVLDLCCGNGLITSRVAQKCRQVVGVDFSPVLIDIAREKFSASNVHYHCLSALEITPQNLSRFAPFSKLYMYEALQHFQEAQLGLLLERLLALSDKDSVILLGSVLHQRRLGGFYNTPELRRAYRTIQRRGDLGLGTWWKQSVIRRTCASYDLRCEFLSQPEELHTACYRFDVRITRK